ncbi:universal stress protein [Lapidilactobacillus gannanensis]|jgi:nucleotide-binding universal stress UspA family protein|uniref:Universal stress protein n=1 Tax=Lapidilactobacillus gannanensis TaxID=2486002 RepID=A0ABW4BJY0_9LACO|nr:universal stress protein [Lapidilactobacillus gannanensis]MCH4057625.1 universal stress protein [Lactobacillaceae bacterium]
MTSDYQKILVAVDDSSDALAAFQYALHRAKVDHAALVITSILESAEMNVYQVLNKDYIHGERAALEHHVNNYVQLAQQAGITNVRAVIAEGDPGETIVKTLIPKYQPDLLIVGAEAKKGLAKHFGSQAAYMAKHANISVMIVRE